VAGSHEMRYTNRRLTFILSYLYCRLLGDGQSRYFEDHFFRFGSSVVFVMSKSNSQACIERRPILTACTELGVCDMSVTACQLSVSRSVTADNNN